MKKTITDSGLPSVKADTIESIVSEVFSKNEYFGLPDFLSSMVEENLEMCSVLYSFIESVSNSLSDDDPKRMDEMCAVAKMSCHLMYKSMAKQIEIERM